MTLRELLEALQKAPPEAMDQEVLLWWPRDAIGGRCHMTDAVEVVQWVDVDKNPLPWRVVITVLEGTLIKKILPETEWRKHLSDVSKFRVSEE